MFVSLFKALKDNNLTASLLLTSLFLLSFWVSIFEMELKAPKTFLGEGKVALASTHRPPH